ncbi:MAG TPA: inositol monophosphatase family protein [Bacteroidia bacterium]|nr:inositol monophosphatase family protein [Bacteroidia bacterium]
MQEVTEAVKATGAFIARERKVFSEKDILAKDTNDLVSYVDKQAEQQLIEKLGKIFPAAGFIAEESSPVANTGEFNWIIDPLDGTTNFIHNIPAYAVSVALASKTEILLGAVYNIPQNELFYTHRNGKAYMNGKEISVSKSTKLSDCLIATGFPVKNFDRLQGFQNATEYFMRNTRGIRRMGAAAVDLCYVACGRFDAFFEYNLNAWDVAAGALIIKQAGGTISDFSGRENYLFGKEMVASNKNVNAAFLQVVSAAFDVKKP